MVAVADANSDTKIEKISKRTTWFGRLRFWTVRLLAGLLLAALSFALAAWILGNTPVNTDFVQTGDDGIEIFVINNGIHADLVLPLNTPRFPWMKHIRTSDFPDYDPAFTHAVFGWGNKKFYLETETWDDLKISNVLHAFSGMGDTIVHVSLRLGTMETSDRVRKIRLSPQQFDRLCQFILKSFKLRSDGTAIVIPGAGYHRLDAFYEAMGHYHLFRTCNVWVGAGLAKAGVRVGYWTLTPDLLFACLPNDSNPSDTNSR